MHKSYNRDRFIRVMFGRPIGLLIASIALFTLAAALFIIYQTI